MTASLLDKLTLNRFIRANGGIIPEHLIREPFRRSDASSRPAHSALDPGGSEQAVIRGRQGGGDYRHDARSSAGPIQPPPIRQWLLVSSTSKRDAQAPQTSKLKPPESRRSDGKTGNSRQDIFKEVDGIFKIAECI